MRKFARDELGYVLRAFKSLLFTVKVNPHEGTGRDASGLVLAREKLEWRPHGDSNPGRDRERVVS
jgi:hypothetical protein